MEWTAILALVLAIPIILTPVVLVWYVNIGGIIAILNKRRKSEAAKWLFDLERKGVIVWEKQDTKVHQYYIEEVDSFIDLLKKS